MKAIDLRFTKEGYFAIGKNPRVIDVDDCMFLISLNQSLAEKVNTIRVYANEYKIAEFSKDAFRIDFSPFEPDVPYHFSQSELSDPWVRLRPEMTSGFSIRFSENTPTRFYNAIEVPTS